MSCEYQTGKGDRAADARNFPILPVATTGIGIIPHRVKGSCGR